MKRFLYQITAFVCLLFIILFAMVFSLNSYIKAKADFTLKEKSEFIIFGPSLPECAYNDSLIENFTNAAKSGEAYFYTFVKASKILEQNSEIKTVFIELSNILISEDRNDWIWSDMYLHRQQPLLALMGWNEMSVLAKNNFPTLFHASANSIVENAAKIASGNYNYAAELGGYNFLVRDKTDSILANLRIDSAQLNDKISEENMVALEKLLALCHAKGKKVFFIRSPLHKKHQGFEHEKTFKALLNNRFSAVELLDFSAVPLENSDFADLEHLNFRGARKYSLWFNSLLKDGLLDKENKQSYINEKAKNIAPH